MEARERLSPGSASAWCTGEGTTFPHARWCSRASAWVADCGVALLGDSLHCFPPDLGQGVNAGLSDVSSLLALWPQDASSPESIQRALEAYHDQQAPEAEAICRLIPIGMPYQYNLPQSFAKFAFFGYLLTRVLANMLMPSFITPPVVFQVTTAPPLRYTHILECHRANTHRLLVVAAVTLSSIMGSLMMRRRRA
ncbi:unnamed protein product [Prorocentrum cordatum]|uniref:FAD-binding domain-containing protein n=1 Tax=Prorocentrum cordatum TaxID=2364126 RepID=A0ABN9Q4C7_9DINO|nr:unnamed protein product [Polarella glacialis]